MKVFEPIAGTISAFCHTPQECGSSHIPDSLLAGPCVDACLIVPPPHVPPSVDAFSYIEKLDVFFLFGEIENLDLLLFFCNDAMDIVSSMHKQTTE